MGKSIFEVGLTLSIETFYKTHLSTEVIGWDVDVFVLTRAIYIEGQPAMLNTGNPLTIRFLRDGIAYGFASEVIAVQFFPSPLLFMKYPAKLETLKLRVAPRYKLDLPARFSDTSGALIAEAVLLDISEGGCGLKVPVQKSRELFPEEGYTVTFKIMDKELSMGCGIKKMDKGKEAYLLGLKFTTSTPQTKEVLTMAIDFLKKHTSS
jgi:c-di-GMP-binding flagellar brake protein YcgR